MNVWFLLWVFLALFILGLFGWSFHILLRQKRAWAEFARKNSLQLNPSKAFASSAVTGNLKSFPFFLYSEEQAINQGGTRRFRTIIQLQLPAPMPVPGVISSAEAGNFARALGLKETYVPEYEFWNRGIVLMTDNAEALKSYLTEERCKSLNALMTIKAIACILIFDDKNTFLRFETADAFDDAARLDRFVQKTLEHARILSF